MHGITVICADIVPIDKRGEHTELINKGWKITWHAERITMNKGDDSLWLAVGKLGGIKYYTSQWFNEELKIQ